MQYKLEEVEAADEAAVEETVVEVDLEDLEVDSSKMESRTKDSTTSCNRGLPKEQLNDVMSDTERKLPFESCGDNKSSSSSFRGVLDLTLGS